MLQIFDDVKLSSNFMKHFYDMPGLPEKTPSLSGGAGSFNKQPIPPPIDYEWFFYGLSMAQP